MLPSPSRAPSALSDMTQYWDRRRKLIGEQTLSGSELKPDGAGSSLCPRTLRAANLAGSRSYLTTSTTIASYRQTNVQVNRLVKFCLLGLMLVLTITVQPIMAARSDVNAAVNGKPWMQLEVDHVIFRNQICHTVSNLVLAKRLQSADGAKDTDGDTSESKRNSGYQQDDPGSAPPPDLDDPDFEENRRTAESEDMYTYDNKDSKVTQEEEETGVDKRTWLPRKKVLKRGLAPKGQKKSNKGKLDVGVENDEDVEAVLSSPEYPYMRRRRRSIDVPEPAVQESFGAQRENSEFNDFSKEDNIDRIASEHKKVGKKSGNLLLRLFEVGKNKSMRKQLKQRIRQNKGILSGNTPWDCQYVSSQKVTTGTFPNAYQDGYCNRSMCFYKLYTCVPVKYVVKLLKRDPHVCNPLPALSNFTIYEEKWEIITRHATVGCNCKYNKPTSGG